MQGSEVGGQAKVLIQATNRSILNRENFGERTDDLLIANQLLRNVGQTPLHCPSSVFPADAFANIRHRTATQSSKRSLTQYEILRRLLF
jgi:hypothetical protein